MKWSIFLFFLLTSIALNGQAADYRIEGAIADDLKSLEATATIRYTNQGATALDTLYFHLWANALGDKSSAYMQQAIDLGMLDAYFDGSKAGYDIESTTLDGQPISLTYAAPDIAYLLLPNRLAPGQSTSLTLSYTLHLPPKHSRLGRTDDGLHLAHWYPRLAAHDQDGWHPMPYLSMGEFYGDYATYDIRLSHPEDLYFACPFATPAAAGTTTARIAADDPPVHDIALFAYRNLRKDHSRIQVGDQSIDIAVYRDPKDKAWDHARESLERAIRYFSETVGPYPYASAIIVQDLSIDRGGMEFPAIATVAGSTSRMVDYYIAHEVGHFWFQGILGFDERSHPWLDEGLTTFYEGRLSELTHGEGYYDAVLPSLATSPHSLPIMRAGIAQQIIRDMDQPMSTPVGELSPINYGINSYGRAAQFWRHMAAYVGEETFDKGIRRLMAEYAYSHPTPAQVQSLLEAESGKDLSAFFTAYIHQGDVDYRLEKSKHDSIRLHQLGSVALPMPLQCGGEITWFMGDAAKRYCPDAVLDPEGITLDYHTSNNASTKPALRLLPRIGSGRKGEVYLSPLVTMNHSDGVGLGAVFFNSTLPAKKLQWLLWPQYSLKSKSITGQAWIQYTQDAAADSWSKIVYRLGAKSFSNNHLERFDSFPRYIRLAPEVRLYQRYTGRSHRESYFRIQHVRLYEQDSRFDIEGGFVGLEYRRSDLSRLGFFTKNSYSLAPSSWSVELESARYENLFGQINDYLKVSAEAKKRYLYAPKFGVDFRLFGAYFLSHSDRESTPRYQNKGVVALLYQGFNDYAYDDYFYNRYDQSGPEQQIALRDGAFKHGTGSARSAQLGQSHDYAAALNIGVDLPIRLPWGLKTRAFADGGLYGQRLFADELKTKYLYSGGLQLSMLRGAVNLYLPVVMSDEIQQVYDEEGLGLLQRLTFSVDFRAFDIWQRLNHERW